MNTKISKSIRLTPHVIPEHYKILLKPDLEGFTFEGEETITLNLKKPTKEITLHAVELEILSATVILERSASAVIGSRSDEDQVGLISQPDSIAALQNDNNIWAGKVSYNEKAETATFTFPQIIPAGQAQLKINFKGILNDKMRGFYRSKYSVDGVEKHMATTQFESTDARRAFPSFDEPSHKATFEVSLMVPPNLTAFSNTIESVVREHESGYQIFDFETTPKMSTYLLAFIIGEFDSIEGKTNRGVRVRVSVTPGKKKQAEFALNVAIKCLDFFEQYFDIPYPLPILDLLAIPDFSAGAMENWGAVTYRETALLIDEDHSSAGTKQRVAIVIAHELAHMWFGDLVTMEWWTHLWLNEGFASYMEYLAVDHIFPEWDLWTQFVDQDHNQALKLDGLENTHPIEVEVHHPDEISEIFDAVSYSKGSSVIRMLANFIGEKNFRDGLRKYLKNHSYSNAKTEDLWTALESISHVPVAKIMKTWTSKPGYPVVTVEQRGQSLELRQQKFFSSPKSKSKNQDKTIWSVPVSVVQAPSPLEGEGRGEGDGVVTKYLMTKKTLNIPTPTKDQWLKINQGESGFFRTQYPPHYLHLLEKPISEKKLSAVDRLGIIRDVFDLSEAGMETVTQGLVLAMSYQDEEDYTVWSQVSSSLHKVYKLIEDDPKLKQQFDKYGLEIFEKIGQKLGWTKKPHEKHTDTLLRSLTLANLGSFGDQKTIAQAKKLFEQLASHKAKLEPDLRGVVYGLVAKNGGPKEYEQVLTMYRQTELQEEKNRLAASLAGFRDKTLIKKTLKFAFSNEVRPQDSFIIIHYVFLNPKGQDLAWEYVKTNWDMLLKRFGGGGHLLPRFISPAATFHTAEKMKDLKTFFKKNPAPGADRTIQQTLEQIESNIAFLKRDGQKIKKFLSVNNEAI